MRIIYWASAFLSLSVVAQDVFTEALESAISTNSEGGIAEYQSYQAREGLSKAYAGWLPQVNLSATTGAEVSHGTKSVETLGSAASYQRRTSRSVGVEVRQNVYNGGATQASIDSGKISLQAQNYYVTAVEQKILLEAAIAFMNYTNSLEILKAYQKNAKVLQRQLDVVTSRYEAGELTVNDVARTQAEVDGANASVIAAQGNTSVYKAEYIRVIGAAPSEASLSLPNVPEHLPASQEEAVRLMYAHNAILKRAKIQTQAARYSIIQAEASLRPSVDITMGANRSLSSSWSKSPYQRQRNNSATVQASIRVPLFNSSLDTEVRNAQYASQRSLVEYQNAEKKSIKETVQAWYNYKTNSAKITQMNSSVKAAKAALEGIKEEYLVGNKTTLDVLLAENKYLSSTISLLEAKKGRVQAAYQLAAAMGMLTPQSLGVSRHLKRASSEGTALVGIKIEKV